MKLILLMNYFYNNLKFFGVFCNFWKGIAPYCIQIERQTIDKSFQNFVDLSGFFILWTKRKNVYPQIYY